MTRKLIFSLLLMYGVLSCTKDSTESFSSVESASVVSQPAAKETVSVDVHAEEHCTYLWISSMQFSNGLLESAEGTDFVSLYDNALSALSFMAAGDFKKAEKILDYFQNRIDIELTSGSGGFYQFRDIRGDNRRNRWLGDNAWLLIAVNNYEAMTGSNRYESLARSLEHWIRSLQDVDGGLWGGYREDGTRIHKISEGIITAFNAVKGYDSFHQGILSFMEKERWNAQDGLLVAWPDNNQYYYALDLIPLGYMILEDFPESTLQQASRFYTSQISELTSRQVKGYCFDEDKDVIWLEGTAQMALAYHSAERQEISKGLLEDLQLMVAEKSDPGIHQGLPYASNMGSSYGPDPLWDHADKQAALSSSNWYFFNKIGFNPLSLGYNKNIPSSHKFWTSDLPLP